ncbi:MAG TPA: M56 family metallopeptidase [Planctomycetaceae bacterium]|nr:M56 family metallopeptidase [Planctomycetaceae bacterium]
MLYGVGVALMLARLSLGVWSANRLGRRGTILRDGPVVERMRTIAAHWSLRAVPLLVRVEEIAIPKVVGLVWPKILLPASALSGLPVSQLELVLIHELAHVRRHDMWVNLLQRVTEAVLFFNPAAWYVSRRIATLREFCCDELTCRTIAPGSAQAKTEYALALLRVAELARRPGGGVAGDGARAHDELVALAATGRTTSQLRARIASLFGEPVRDPLRLSTGGMLLVAALALALVVGPISWRMAAKSADGKSEQPVLSATVPIDVSGTALDDVSGKPIAGATIHIESGGLELRKTVTDKTGRFEFHSVELPIARVADNHGRDTGRFLVYGEAAGHGFAWRPEKLFLPNPNSGDSFLANPSREQPEHYFTGDKIELDLRFAKATVVRGRIVDETGRPIPGTRVSIANCERIRAKGSGSRQDGVQRKPFGVLDPNGFSLAEAGLVTDVRTRHTDADGRFEFTEIPAGCGIHVGVVPPGFVGRFVWVVTQTGQTKDCDGVTVFDGEKDVRLSFPFPHEVSVRVVYGDTGQAAGHAFVSVGDRRWASGEGGSTDALGKAAFKLPFGEYSLKIIPATGTPYLLSTGSFKLDAKSAGPIIGRLRRAAQVEIRVVDKETGRGIPKVDFWAAGETGGEQGGRTDYYSTSFEESTGTVYRERKRTDNNGVIRELFEPGKHRIGVGRQAYPIGYEITQPDGQEFDCRAGDTTVVEFRLPKRAALTDQSRSRTMQPGEPAAGETATAGDLSRYAVVIEAESRPRGISRSFPAIVMASERGKSILLSASWGALPFPLQKNGVPIGALFLRDGNDPVDVIAYDQRLGIGIFSVDRVLDPLPQDSFTEEIAVGDRLTDLRLSQEDSERTLRVLAVDEAYRDQVDVSGRTVVVEHTIRLDGKMRQNPGSVLLKQGKIAAIFLNNGRFPATDKGKFFPYALPVRYARRAFAELVAAHAAAAKTPGPAQPVFIVAKRVMLHDGQVITWDGIRDVLKRMAGQGPIHPSFQLTNGVVEQSQQTQAQVGRLEREVGFDGFNFGFLWPRAGKRYDAIRSQQDLKPNASEVRQGSVRLPDGSPAVGAQVVLLPNDAVEVGGGFTMYLVDGQLREPYLEIMTQTDAAGLFTVYPTGRFQLVILHKAGIALVNSDQKAGIALLNGERFRDPAITLRPWVTVVGAIDRSDNPKETVGLTSNLKSADGWPAIQAWESDLPIAKDGSFESRVLAPGEIHVMRNIPGDQGTSYLLHAKLIENAQPGSVQRVAIGRMTAADVKSLDSLRGIMEHRAQAVAGRFSGVVRLEGKSPEPQNLVQNPGVNNGKPIRDESLRVNRTVGNGIANVFIYLAAPPAGTAAAIPPRPFVLKSDAVNFSPRASIARVGQKLRLQNDGQSAVNFHLFPERNPGINHIVRAGQTAELGPRFAVSEPAPFDVRDDRFAWKRAFVLVVDHPFAAVTDELGAFEIADLPPGKYSFRVWHERSGFLDKTLAVEIKPGETTKKMLSYGLDRFER